MSTVEIKSYSAPALKKDEVLHYLRTDKLDEAVLNECLSLLERELIFKVCYTSLPLTIKDEVCDFADFSVKSSDLAKNLRDCDSVILFAATVGVGIDRLISKYSRISPLKAVFIDAIGAERIESLCDRFCDDLRSLHNIETRPRFSAGYGDLPLETQKQIISVLNTSKNIGVSLTNSLFLTPTKSVTAFIGIKKG